MLLAGGCSRAPCSRSSSVLLQCLNGDPERQKWLIIALKPRFHASHTSFLWPVHRERSTVTAERVAADDEAQVVQSLRCQLLAAVFVSRLPTRTRCHEVCQQDMKSTSVGSNRNVTLGRLTPANTSTTRQLATERTSS